MAGTVAGARVGASLSNAHLPAVRSHYACIRTLVCVSLECWDYAEDTRFVVYCIDKLCVV